MSDLTQLRGSIQVAAPSDEVLAVHDALDALSAEDATAAKVEISR